MTDTDVAALRQERYGYTKDQAKKAVDDYFDKA